MYGPDATHTAGWNWANATLDFNHDDYYGPTSQGVAISRTVPTWPHCVPSRSWCGARQGHEQPGGNRLSRRLHRDVPRACHADGEAAFEGAIFNGWTGGCNGGATCVVNGEASAAASFSASSQRTHSRCAFARSARRARYASWTATSRAARVRPSSLSAAASAAGRPFGDYERTAPACSPCRSPGAVRPTVPAHETAASGERCIKAMSGAAVASGDT